MSNLLRSFGVLLVWFGPLAASAAVAPDELDQVRLAVGLRDQGLRERSITECDKFLTTYPRSVHAPLVRYTRAQCLFELRRFDRAVEAFRELTALHPTYAYAPESRFRIGECLLRLDKPEEAVETFAAFVRDHPGHYLNESASFWIGEAAFRAGSFDRAERLYRAFLRQFPNAEQAAEARRGLVWSLFRLKRYTDVIAEAGRALPGVRDGVEAAEIQYLLGESFFQEKRWNEALAAYVRVGNDPTYGDDAQMGQAYALASAERKKDAARVFADVPRAWPRSPLVFEARLRAGLLYVDLGEVETARGLLEPVLESARDPHDVQETRLALGRIERKADRPKVAELHLREAMKGPDENLTSEARLSLADLLVSSGRAAEAQPLYDQAARGAQGDYALAALVLAAFNEERWEQVAQQAQRFKTTFPTSEYLGEVAFALAESLFAQGDYRRALVEFDFVRARNAKRVATADYRKAWCHYRLDDVERAQAAFARFLADHSDDPRRGEVFVVLGRIALDRGRPDEAEQFYRQALRGDVGEYADDCSLGLARALVARKLTTPAIEVLDGFEARHPGSPLLPRALFELGELRYQRKEYEAASAAYTRVITSFPEDPVVPYALHGDGWARLELGDANVALERAQATAATGVEALQTPALELEAAAHRAAGDAAKAGEALIRLAATRQDPTGRIDAALDAARSLRDGGEVARALALLQSVLRQPQTNHRQDELYFEYGALAREGGQAEAGRAAFLELIARHPSSTWAGEAAFQLGEDAYANEELDEAIGRYDFVLAQERTPADLKVAVAYKRGWAHLKKEEFEKAFSDFERTALGDPEGALAGEALFLAGECKFRLGAWGEAVKRFQQVRREFPGHGVQSRNLFRLGLAQGELANWEGCYEALRELLESQPDFKFASEAHLWVGRSLRSRNQSRAAVDYLERVESQAEGPIQAGMKIEAGRALLDMGRTDDAIGKFLQVKFVYAYPDEVAEATYWAAEGFVAKGEKENAIKFYKEIVERYADSPHARDARTKLASLSG
ncbi:MAG: tetratricopeptide repeat protein [Planctomycetes bacterium]|nr:tetratricopeptide repeat protein [Planctomycetota bacterium]